MGAGITESILVNPFEVVKVTQQSNKSKISQVPSAWEVTREIIKTDVSDDNFMLFRNDEILIIPSIQGFGLRGINKGLFATIWRNGSFNCIYFGFYHSVKEMIPEQKVHEM